MSLLIGDTPAQLGQIEAADAMMIDGKIVTRDDYRALQERLQRQEDQLLRVSKELTGLASSIVTAIGPKFAIHREALRSLELVRRVSE